MNEQTDLIIAQYIVRGFCCVSCRLVGLRPAADCAVLYCSAAATLPSCSLLAVAWPPGGGGFGIRLAPHMALFPQARQGTNFPNINSAVCRPWAMASSGKRAWCVFPPPTATMCKDRCAYLHEGYARGLAERWRRNAVIVSAATTRTNRYLMV